MPRHFGWLARLVPRARRRDWLREWQAELTYQRHTGSVRSNGFAALEDALGQRWRALRPGAVGGGGSGFSPATLLIDLRHALRALRRNPGPLVLSGVSLSMAIGATATMLSVVDAIDLRPLPYRDAGRLVQLTQVSGEADSTGLPASPALFHEWQEHATSFAALGAASPIAVGLGDDGDSLAAARTTEGFFEALGATPLLGRVYTAQEVRAGTPVLVISHAVWRGRFGSDPDIIGRTVSLSWAGEFRGVAASPYTVVGVLPVGVRYPRGSDAWLPAADAFGGPSDNPMLTVLGRLREGVSSGSAQAEIATIAGRLSAREPEAHAGTTGVVNTVREAIQARAASRGSAARLVFLAVAVFVLLLATVNTAVVFLVRMARQQHDLVVRSALGAPRARLVTLTLAQSLVIALVAGAGGIALAYWGIEVADARLSVSDSGFAPMLDWRVVAATIGLSVATGIASGLLAAVRLARVDLHQRLGARAGGGMRGLRARRLQGALLVAQVASAMVLLHGAGVLSRELVTLVTRDPGFDAESLLVAALQLATTHEDAATTLERIERLPGIQRAALAARPGVGYRYRVEDGDWLSGPQRPFPYRAGPGYFETLGIPLLAGREFVAADRTGSEPVAIVSRMAARAWWPGAEAVGKRFLMENDSGVGEWVTVVGVSQDERASRDVSDALRPVLYRPWDQLTGERRRAQILARAAGTPETLIPEIRSILRATRSSEGWQGDYVVSMRTVVGDYLGLQRFRTSAMLVFSLFALTLASMGIYGAVAAVASQRTAEIGVRMALGARPVDVLTLVARGGVGLALAGTVLGLLGALAAQGVLDALLASQEGPDPAVMAATALLLVAVVGLASYMPAQRATRIDPVSSMRE